MNKTRCDFYFNGYCAWYNFDADDYCDRIDHKTLKPIQGGYCPKEELERKRLEQAKTENGE